MIRVCGVLLEVEKGEEGEEENEEDVCLFRVWFGGWWFFLGVWGGDGYFNGGFKTLEEVFKAT